MIRISLLLIVVVSSCALINMPSEADDKKSKDGQTVSCEASKDPASQWTLERMLLATPMPMTAEGRKFLSTHSSLDGICSWSYVQFEKYLDSEFARQHLAEEAFRWRDLASMLERQVVKGSICLGKECPLPPARPQARDWKKTSTEEFRKLIDGRDRQIVFEQMKNWRKEIAEYAPIAEALRNQAKEKGLSQKLEEAMSEN